MGVCSRAVFGVEPSQMSFLFFLMYAAAAGGLDALLESTSGGAQEIKIKVSQSRIKMQVSALVLVWLLSVPTSAKLHRWPPQ